MNNLFTFPDTARFQARPSTRKGSQRMDGNRIGQEIPQKRTIRGVHQRRSSTVPTHKRDQPWKCTQIQHYRWTIQNDGKHQPVSITIRFLFK